MDKWESQWNVRGADARGADVRGFVVREPGRRPRLPLPDGEMAEMFATLEREGALSGCDHTLRRTRAWLAARGYAEGPVVAWLQNTGGYCDCEVLLNSMHEWTCARQKG